MKTFAIHFSPDSYIAENQKVRDIGEIYIQLNDHIFPEKGWTDFGKTIVFWWMDAFLKLLSGEEKKVQCDFMKGPYRFDVQAVSSTVWAIQLLEERANFEEIGQEGEISAEQAIEELLRVVAEIKVLIERKGDASFLENIENFTQKFLLARQKILASAN